MAKPKAPNDDWVVLELSHSDRVIRKGSLEKKVFNLRILAGKVRINLKLKVERNVDKKVRKAKKKPKRLILVLIALTFFLLHEALSGSFVGSKEVLEFIKRVVL